MSQVIDSTYVLEVRGDKQRQLWEDVDRAVEQAIAHAIEIGHHGVLVTQHNCHFYSVTLSKNVPYGQTQELRSTPFESVKRATELLPVVDSSR